MRFGAVLGFALLVPCASAAQIQIVDVQYRLVWPETGGLSPDVVAAQETWDAPSIFCGEVAFANGESWQQLGAPFEGVLLVGVTAAPGTDGRALGILTLHEPHNPPTSRGVAGRAGEITWYPLAILPLWGGMHHLDLEVDGGPRQPLPQVDSGCAE